jgi:NAD(P)-dependent dehydrogenase (short-subunit alcohol dehydrogenase family)
VAGASGTVGQAVSRALAARGVRVGLTYHRNEAVAAALAAELPGAALRRLDLTATADIPRVLDELGAELGGVDAFVHAAGIGSTASPPAYDRLGETQEPGWDRLMAVHVRSAFFAAQHLAGKMKGGNLVFVGSMNGVKSAPAPVPYATATGALRAMTTALAKELGPRDLRVNMVAAGILESGISGFVPEDLKSEYKKHSALKRLGKVSEVAELVAWLAVENTYVTGRTIALDGGL